MCALDFNKVVGLLCVRFVDELVRCSIKILTCRTEYSEKEFKEQLETGNTGLKIKTIAFFGSKHYNKIESLVTFGLDKDAYESIVQMGSVVNFDCLETKIIGPENRGATANKRLKVTHVK